MNISFTKKEIVSLLIATLVLGFVFGFDDGRPTFVLNLWLANYVLMSILALLALSLMIIGHKIAAARYKIKSDFTIWGISRFGFHDFQYFQKKGEPGGIVSPIAKIPLGVILPIIVALLTQGKVWLAAVGMIITSVNTTHRLTKKYLHIADFEEARIALAGPLTLTILLIILSVTAESYKIPLVTNLMVITGALIISNLLPLPQLAGGKMLFTSPYLYIFTTIIMVGITLLMLMIPTLPAIGMSFVLAVLTTFLTYFKKEV